MADELISIIVPVYNVEQYLRKCLDSIVNQTHKNIEIICVNDGSPDKSGEIIDEYGSKDQRVRHIKMVNEGVSSARNRGLDEARGDYTMFVDSDDWIENDFCEKMLKVAVKSDADVVMCDYIREYHGNSKPKNILNKDAIFNKDDVMNKLHRRMVGITGEELRQPENADAFCTVWGKLYRRYVISNNNILFYDIHKIGTYEDGLFNLDVFSYAEKVVYIHEFLYHYRKDNLTSITHYNPNMVPRYEHILDYLDAYMKKGGYGEDYKTALNNRTALAILGYGFNLLGTGKHGIKRLRGILSQDRYHNALCAMDMSYLPPHWKLFFECARYRLAMAVYLMTKAVKFLKSK